jgi:hypothetical protein
MTTTDRHPDPGDRYVGQAITRELLLTEALRLDATNAGGPASWALGEAAALLRLTADHLVAAEAVADWPRPVLGPVRRGLQAQCRAWDREVNGR